MFATAGGAGRSAGSGKCGNNPEDGGSVWGDGSGDVVDGTGRDGEPVFTEGAEGFGGSGAASAGAGGNVADDFADATEDERDSHAGVVRTGCDENGERFPFAVGSGLVPADRVAGG